MRFLEKLHLCIERTGSRLCVGLDPTLDALPEGLERSPDGVLAFNRAIMEATADLVCAFKPNLAFYEALGSDGWRVLEETVRSAPPHVPVIADAKRGDIGSTAAAYAVAIFERLGCDACTLSPYLGLDAIEPFIDRPDRFAFILCRTSNPGAGQFQDLSIDGDPLFVHVARRIAAWERADRCGLVVGATDPEAARAVAQAAPHLWLLSPGLGAQGGGLSSTASLLGASAQRTVWNASRGVSGAGRGRDFAERARDAAMRLRDEIAAATPAAGL